MPAIGGAAPPGARRNWRPARGAEAGLYSSGALPLLHAMPAHRERAFSEENPPIGARHGTCLTRPVIAFR